MTSNYGFTVQIHFQWTHFHRGKRFLRTNRFRSLLGGCTGKSLRWCYVRGLGISFKINNIGNYDPFTDTFGDISVMKEDMFLPGRSLEFLEVREMPRGDHLIDYSRRAGITSSNLFHSDDISFLPIESLITYLSNHHNNMQTGRLPEGSGDFGVVKDGKLPFQKEVSALKMGMTVCRIEDLKGRIFLIDKIPAKGLFHCWCEDGNPALRLISGNLEPNIYPVWSKVGTDQLIKGWQHQEKLCCQRRKNSVGKLLGIRPASAESLLHPRDINALTGEWLKNLATAKRRNTRRWSRQAGRRYRILLSHISKVRSQQGGV